MPQVVSRTVRDSSHAITRYVRASPRVSLYRSLIALISRLTPSRVLCCRCFKSLRPISTGGPDQWAGRIILRTPPLPRHLRVEFSLSGRPWLRQAGDLFLMFFEEYDAHLRIPATQAAVTRLHPPTTGWQEAACSRLATTAAALCNLLYSRHSVPSSQASAPAASRCLACCLLARLRSPPWLPVACSMVTERMLPPRLLPAWLAMIGLARADRRPVRLASRWP